MNSKFSSGQEALIIKSKLIIKTFDIYEDLLFLGYRI